MTIKGGEEVRRVPLKEGCRHVVAGFVDYFL